MNKNNNRYGYQSWTAEEVKKYGKFFILPLIALVLIVVILIADRGEETGTTVEPSPSETESQTEIPSGENPEDVTATEIQRNFSTNEVPEIVELMNRYFTAKQNADCETIYQLYRTTDTSGMDELLRKLQYDARYTSGYENITCYTKPGAQEGSYLTYVTYDLAFKNTETRAPGFVRNYVKRDEEGNYYLTYNKDLTEQELNEMTEAEKDEELVLLRTQTLANLRKAVESDSVLAENYAIVEKGVRVNQEETSENEPEVSIGGAGESRSEAPENAGEEPDTQASQSDQPSTQAETQAVEIGAPVSAESAPPETPAPAEETSATSETNTPEDNGESPAAG